MTGYFCLPDTVRGERQKHHATRVGERRYRMLLSLHVRLAIPPSELITETNAGIEGRGVVAASRIDRAGIRFVRQQEAAREAVVDLRPHHAGEGVHVPGEAPIENQRDRVERAGALRGNRCVTTSNRTRAEAVLRLVIVRSGDIESRRDRILRTDPEGLQYLVVRVFGVVDR